MDEYRSGVRVTGQEVDGRLKKGREGRGEG